MPYTEGTIALNYAGLTLTLSRFTDTSYPREEIKPPEVAFSARGTPALLATRYELKHIWNLTFYLNEEEQRILDTMWRFFVVNQTEVMVDDYTREIFESNPRSRSLATDAIETAITTPASWTRYYARFQGFFTSPPAYQKSGFEVLTKLQITETTKTNPL